jgi:inorganic pyrophosphatase
MTRLPAFRSDGSLNVIVESPRGSTVKFKYDPENDVMTVSRPLPLGLSYPHDWGFVPSTRAADGDPLDAWVAWDVASYPGIVIPSRVIGLLRVEQTEPESPRRDRNDRLAVLPLKAPRQEHIRSVFDLGKRDRAELEQFFLHAAALEGKDLTVLGWAGPDEALPIVRQAAMLAGTYRHT